MLSFILEMCKNICMQMLNGAPKTKLRFRYCSAQSEADFQLPLGRMFVDKYISSNVVQEVCFQKTEFIGKLLSPIPFELFPHRFVGSSAH